MRYAPALLGILIVIQAGINRKIAGHWGLPAAVLLNGVVLTLFAAALFGVAVYRPQALPGGMSLTLAEKSFPLWFLIPGFIGFLLVFGGPWFIARFGAVHTFVLIVSAQLLMSLIWDWQVEKIEISKERLLGLAITWLGVFLATRGQVQIPPP